MRGGKKSPQKNKKDRERERVIFSISPPLGWSERKDARAVLASDEPKPPFLVSKDSVNQKPQQNAKTFIHNFILFCKSHLANLLLLLQADSLLLHLLLLLVTRLQDVTESLLQVHRQLWAQRGAGQVSLVLLHNSEASLILIVPDFTTSKYGSSCNYLFFLLILAPVVSSLSIYWHPVRKAI